MANSPQEGTGAGSVPAGSLWFRLRQARYVLVNAILVDAHAHLWEEKDAHVRLESGVAPSVAVQRIENSRNSMHKTAIRVVGMAALAFASLTALQAAEGQEKVNEVLSRYVKALGGKEAIEKVKSRVIKGTAEGMGMPAGLPWEFYAAAPNKQLSKVEVTGFGAVLEGFDGQVAWSKNPITGVRVKEGDELAKVKREAGLDRELRFLSIYPDLAYKGTEKMDNEEVVVLETKPTPTTSERFSFSNKTGLLVRQESQFQTAQGAVKTEARMSDYRAVDGLQFPFLLKVKAEAPGQDPAEFTIKVSEVKYNVPVSDSLFAKPAN
ncbi:MAG: outer membrane lipoprotein-sorting protein [Verrucomicrobia bacterium]|nr:outer membrane lipoprotein-sorting protein [Verrucomicrobiota bacterium]